MSSNIEKRLQAPTGPKSRERKLFCADKMAIFYNFGQSNGVFLKPLELTGVPETSQSQNNLTLHVAIVFSQKHVSQIFCQFL